MLVDHFHLQLATSPADLTDLQLRMVYFHPRDNDGRLIQPLSGPDTPEDTEPQTLEQALKQLESIHNVFKLNKLEEAKEALKRKWQQQHLTN